MKQDHHSSSVHISSKPYIMAVAEAIFFFTIATFCLGIYFTHQGAEYIFSSVIIIALYLFVVITSIKFLVQRSSIAAIMLMIPIAPLLILIIVVALLHILQLLR